VEQRAISSVVNVCNISNELRRVVVKSNTRSLYGKPRIASCGTQTTFVASHTCGTSLKNLYLCIYVYRFLFKFHMAVFKQRHIVWNQFHNSRNPTRWATLYYLKSKKSEVYNFKSRKQKTYVQINNIVYDNTWMPQYLHNM